MLWWPRGFVNSKIIFRRCYLLLFCRGSHSLCLFVIKSILKWIFLFVNHFSIISWVWKCNEKTSCSKRLLLWQTQLAWEAQKIFVCKTPALKNKTKSPQSQIQRFKMEKYGSFWLLRSCGIHVLSRKSKNYYPKKPNDQSIESTDYQDHLVISRIFQTASKDRFY